MESSDVGSPPVGGSPHKTGNRDIALSLVLIVFSVILYLYDIVTDITVVEAHYRDGNFTYFYWTLSFIVVPVIIMTCFSLRFYQNDDKKFKEQGLPRASPVVWVIRFIFLILPAGPLLRDMIAMYYGVKALLGGHNQAFCKKKMMCERNDATFLRIIESFLESGPQFLLQFYIVAVQGGILSIRELTKTEMLQLASMFGAFVSMPWTLVSYQRSNRNVFSLNKVNKKIPLSIRGSVVMFLWHFFEVGARILALGLFTSVFPVCGIIVCLAHLGIMFVWIRSMKTTFCETRFDEIIYNIVLAIVFVFCYLGPKESTTRWQYIKYYIFTFLENTILMVVWYNCTDASPYKLAAMLIHFLGFLIGIMLMVIYYLLLHPTQNIHIFKHSAEVQCESCAPREVTCDSVTAFETTV